jgi:hypothetical protein
MYLLLIKHEVLCNIWDSSETFESANILIMDL